MRKKSLLEELRLQYKPKISKNIKNVGTLVSKKVDTKEEVEEKLKRRFPKTFSQPLIHFEEVPSKQNLLEKKSFKENQKLIVGVVFSGGQAPGGHNVIAGLFDALQELSNSNILYGFLNGPSGIVENKYIEIKKELIDNFRNQGGFDLIGSGRTKIETDEQLASSLNTAKKLNLDGLIIIGGDDSNTNAAVLAEYFLQHNCKTRVAGVPKTIDGDLKNKYISISFGFDTASKVYAELIGNIERDALSAKKYYHFIKLMGRSASHIALECALNTQPNYAIIAEEVKEKKQTLDQITKELTDLICKRAASKKNYGVILIPEGLIEFIPEMKVLIKELNNLLAEGQETKNVEQKLSSEAKKTFESLPEKIQRQLLLDRDPHGNVQVSKIETEKLLIETVKKELKNRNEYKSKFSTQAHFLGYEGRAAFPSNFDANYCYALGHVAVALIKEKHTGYICCVSDMLSSADKWTAKGIPLVKLMHLEVRKGKEKPVIKKALVELDSEIFQTFAKNRKNWEVEDQYIYPGPVQYFGEEKLTDTHPIILK